MSSEIAVWASEPSSSLVEIASLVGFDSVVLDIEHGSFDLSSLNWIVPFIRAQGMSVIAKVTGPSREPIQQALDFGADTIAIPHIESAEHAHNVTAFAKFPPMGKRSFAGGRTANYGPVDDAWISEQDQLTKCLPMIEDATAVEEIEAILDLETVDGVFIGPTDLSLLRNRGAYKAGDEDFEDLTRISRAAIARNKRWIIPAWTLAEKQFAVDEKAHTIVSVMQHGALAAGLRTSYEEVATYQHKKGK